MLKTAKPKIGVDVDLNTIMSRAEQLTLIVAVPDEGKLTVCLVCENN